MYSKKKSEPRKSEDAVKEGTASGEPASSRGELHSAAPPPPPAPAPPPPPPPQIQHQDATGDGVKISATELWAGKRKLRSVHRTSAFDPGNSLVPKRT